MWFYWWLFIINICGVHYFFFFKRWHSGKICVVNNIKNAEKKILQKILSLVDTAVPTPTAAPCRNGLHAPR